jgi:hypothetical protein
MPFVLAFGLGCSHTQQMRLQAADETDKDRYGVKTIGDVSVFGNIEAVSVGGIGIVTDLEGTGGGTPPSYRTQMADELRKDAEVRKKGYDQRINEIIDSKNNAVVLVHAVIPPGVHKNEPIDVEISLPPGSKATSLRGGYLKQCVLYSYDSSRHLGTVLEKTAPNAELAAKLSQRNLSRPDNMVKGLPYLKAEGPIQVGFGEGDESGYLKRGVIWSGGRCQKAFSFFIVLNDDSRYSMMAQAVADRINETFHPGGLHSEVAVAKTKGTIELNVPEQYRHNLPRFLRVVRAIPVRETSRVNDLHVNSLTGPGAQTLAATTRSSYGQKLAEELLDPARTIIAAIRLEALGEESSPFLKKGLQSTHDLVRFASAEALAYLDCPSGGEELGRLVEKQPALRAFCLTALASLNQSVSQVELTRLLNSPSPETRYGAFRALRARDEGDSEARGEFLNDSFHFYRVASESPPLVHLSMSRRAELVLFGAEPGLKAPFQFVAGDFAVTAKEGADQCTISRVSVQRGVSKKVCSLKLNDIVHTLTDMGGTYAETVELVKQADKCRSLTCPVAIDALPQATSVFELARAGKNGNDLERALDEEEIRQARSEFGATPTLFEKVARRTKALSARDEEALLRDRKSGDDDKKTAQR